MVKPAGLLLVRKSRSLGKYAYFSQMGGTTEIGGGLSAPGGLYNLYSGKLETPYTGVGADPIFVYGGGQHLVNGVLSITGIPGGGSGTSFHRLSPTAMQ